MTLGDCLIREAWVSCCLSELLCNTQVIPQLQSAFPKRRFHPFFFSCQNKWILNQSTLAFQYVQPLVFMNNLKVINPHAPVTEKMLEGNGFPSQTSKVLHQTIAGKKNYPAKRGWHELASDVPPTLPGIITHIPACETGCLEELLQSCQTYILESFK